MKGVCSACLIRVCVVHVQPIFLPVEIMHNQCRCRFFDNINREINAHLPVATKLRHIDLQHAGQTRQCHIILPDTTGTTYSAFFAKEKIKGTQEPKQKKQTNKQKRRENFSTQMGTISWHLHCPLCLLRDTIQIHSNICLEFHLCGIEELAQTLVVLGAEE